MPPRELLADYWDSCVFLSYLNGQPSRAPVICQCLAQIERDSHRRIVTSTFTAVEVAYVSQEKDNRRPDPTIEAAIDSLLHQHYIVLVQAGRAVIEQARRLMRLANLRGNKLTPSDAIHLGTAAWLMDSPYTMGRILTYDSRWTAIQDLVGLEIGEPETNEPQMSLQFPG